MSPSPGAPNVVQAARTLGVVLRLHNAAKPPAFYSGVARASVHDAWTTPAGLLEKLYPMVGGTFTLDPCSPTWKLSQAPVRAGRHYTVEDDGLALAWDGDGDVFMNPPYDRGIRRGVAKARQEVEQGHAVSLLGLIPSRTGASWWHASVAQVAHVWQLDERLRFGGLGGNGSPFDSALVLGGGDDLYRAGLHAAFPPGKASYVQPSQRSVP